MLAIVQHLAAKLQGRRPLPEEAPRRNVASHADAWSGLGYGAFDQAEASPERGRVLSAGWVMQVTFCLERTLQSLFRVLNG